MKIKGCKPPRQKHSKYRDWIVRSKRSIEAMLAERNPAICRASRTDRADAVLLFEVRNAASMPSRAP
jgi:hypothetical protein